MLEPRIFIEKPVDENELLAAATDAERITAAGFGSQRRRREYLMWRHIVRRELGAQTEIEYLPSGRPVVNHPDTYIGVSHDRDYVAVIISQHPCAIDIEPLSRDFTRAVGRCTTEEERSLSDDVRSEAALWCAKETLYKYISAKEHNRTVDFASDICIKTVDFGRGIIVGSICGGEDTEMRMLEHEGHLIVFVG